MLGSYEQMGPSSLSESAEFWKSLSVPAWEGLNGTRLDSSERFCAVSLVKRFMWPAFFAGSNGKLGLEPRELRFSDTATIAAAKWLEKAPTLVPYDVVARRWLDGDWNGQWLHWTTPDEGVEKCPEPLFNSIQAHRRKMNSAAPTYYALLHVDGDNMGRLFQDDSAGREHGLGRYRAVSERLTRFSADHVGKIVEQHSGELVYAGGDDVLALLPTETAIECGADLRRSFGSSEVLGDSASLSAGIAVVHYKEDLRHALALVRQAERAAKNIGLHSRSGAPPAGKDRKKDALAIVVCRNSGEDTAAVASWCHAKAIGELIRLYQLPNPPSDRWSYKLRDEVSILQGLPPGAVRTELVRLLKRASDPTERLSPHVLQLFDEYMDEMTGNERGWPYADALAEFATLCQTISFLSRGRE